MYLTARFIAKLFAPLTLAASSVLDSGSQIITLPNPFLAAACLFNTTSTDNNEAPSSPPSYPSPQHLSNPKIPSQRARALKKSFPGKDNKRYFQPLMLSSSVSTSEQKVELSNESTLASLAAPEKPFNYSEARERIQSGADTSDGSSSSEGGSSDSTEDTHEDTSYYTQSDSDSSNGPSTPLPRVENRVIKPLPTRRRSAGSSVTPTRTLLPIPAIQFQATTTTAPERKIKALSTRRTVRRNTAGPTVPTQVTDGSESLTSNADLAPGLDLLASAASSRAYQPSPTRGPAYSTLSGALDNSNINWNATRKNPSGQVSANEITSRDVDNGLSMALSLLNTSDTKDIRQDTKIDTISTSTSPSKTSIPKVNSETEASPIKVSTEEERFCQPRQEIPGQEPHDGAEAEPNVYPTKAAQTTQLGTVAPEPVPRSTTVKAAPPHTEDGESSSLPGATGVLEDLTSSVERLRADAEPSGLPPTAVPFAGSKQPAADLSSGTFERPDDSTTSDDPQNADAEDEDDMEEVEIPPMPIATMLVGDGQREISETRANERVRTSRSRLANMRDWRSLKQK